MLSQAKSQLLRYKMYYACGLLGLIVSLVFNPFGIKWVSDFDQFSEELVTKTVSCAQSGDYRGNLIVPENYHKTFGISSSEHCAVYSSQFGLQGFVMAKFVPNNPEHTKAFVYLAKLFLISIFSLILMAFILFCHVRYGAAAAVLTFLLTLFSVWTTAYAGNLYWASYLMFLPFIFSLLFYPYFKDRKNEYLFYVILGLLLLIKFLAGYEFITVITFSALSAITYWEVQSRIRFKELIKRTALVIGVALVSFVLAFSLHVTSLKGDYGSYGKAFEAVAQRGTLRTHASGLYQYALPGLEITSPSLYKKIDTFMNISQYHNGKANGAVYWAVLWASYLALPVITLPVVLGGGVALLLESLGFWLILWVLVIVQWRKKKYLTKDKNKRGTVAAAAVGLMGALSWFVFAPGHVMSHVHIDMIIFYIPFLLWTYLIVSVWVVERFREWFPIR